MSDVVRIQPTPATIVVDGGDVPVQEISLGGVPRGLVIFLGEHGDDTNEAAEIMNAVAEHGYESIAAEVSATGDGSKLMEALLDRGSSRDWAREQIGLIGIGAGGTAVLEAATRLECAAAVSLSPTTEPPDRPATTVSDGVRTPWLGMYGELDPHLQEQSRLDDQLRNANDVFTRVVVYPGVGHDFHRHGRDGISYAASYDAWERTIEWLNARVKPRETPLARAFRSRA